MTRILKAIAPAMDRSAMMILPVDCPWTEGRVAHWLRASAAGDEDACNPQPGTRTHAIHSQGRGSMQSTARDEEACNPAWLESASGATYMPSEQQSFRVFFFSLIGFIPGLGFRARCCCARREARRPLSGVEVRGWGPRYEDMPGVAPRLRWHGRASRPRTADGGIAPECGLVRPC